MRSFWKYKMQVPYKKTGVLAFKIKVTNIDFRHYISIMSAIMEKKNYSRDKFVLVELFQKKLDRVNLIFNYGVMEIENILRLPFIRERIDFDALTNLMINDPADTMKFIFVEKEKVVAKSWSKKINNTKYYRSYKKNMTWRECANPGCTNMTVPFCDCCNRQTYCSNFCYNKHLRAGGA